MFAFFTYSFSNAIFVPFKSLADISSVVLLLNRLFMNKTFRIGAILAKWTIMSRSSTFLQSVRKTKYFVMKKIFFSHFLNVKNNFSFTKPAAGINIAGFSPILIHFLRCFCPQKCARAIGGYGRSTLQLSQKILSCFFSSIFQEYISIKNYIEIQESSTHVQTSICLFCY